MLFKCVHAEDHLVAVDIEHSSRQYIVPNAQLVKGVARLSLDPLFELLKHDWNEFILTLQGYFFADEQEFLHFVNLLDLVDQHVLGNLG